MTVIDRVYKHSENCIHSFSNIKACSKLKYRIYGLCYIQSETGHEEAFSQY